MNKDVYKEVSNRASEKCEVCKQYYGDRLELHHILRRKVKETQDNCIMLCPSCHRGTNGVHGKNGHELDLQLKKQLQEFYTVRINALEEVRVLMGGRLY